MLSHPKTRRHKEEREKDSSRRSQPSPEPSARSLEGGPGQSNDGLAVWGESIAPSIDRSGRNRLIVRVLFRRKQVHPKKKRNTKQQRKNKGPFATCTLLGEFKKMCFFLFSPFILLFETPARPLHSGRPNTASLRTLRGPHDPPTRFASDSRVLGGAFGSIGASRARPGHVRPGLEGLGRYHPGRRRKKRSSFASTACDPPTPRCLTTGRARPSIPPRRFASDAFHVGLAVALIRRVDGASRACASRAGRAVWTGRP